MIRLANYAAQSKDLAFADPVELLVPLGHYNGTTHSF